MLSTTDRIFCRSALGMSDAKSHSLFLFFYFRMSKHVPVRRRCWKAQQNNVTQ